MGVRPDHRDITRLLEQWSEGRDEAFDELFPLVYEDLSRIARNHLRGEGAGHTLSTQALVHESYMRLLGKPGSGWESRSHFYAVASRAMRRILIDYARKKQTEKRGGARARITLGEDVKAPERDLDELLAIEQGLEELETLDPRLVRIVECRFFGGLTMAETAEALGTSVRTVERGWTRARGHLYRRLAAPDESERADGL